MNTEYEYYVFYGQQYWGKVKATEQINLPDGAWYGPSIYQSEWMRKGYEGYTPFDELPKFVQLMYSLLPKD